ncbi:MAG: hypothetical protein SFU84_09480 [Gemmatimonadales bacterium]|nr:hypothetical protein [Gemmatimonadales bacterium]
MTPPPSGSTPRTTPSRAAPTVAEPIVPSPALAEAMGAVLKESARRIAVAEAPPPAPSVPSGWLAAALGTWLVVAWLLLATPAIARGPMDRPWQAPVAEREASLRYGLWLARDRVDGFRRENGRLPSFLAEAGVLDTSLTLVVEGERNFTLEGRDGPMRLSLASAMAADSFLGSSLRLLRGE